MLVKYCEFNATAEPESVTLSTGSEPEPVPAEDAAREKISFIPPTLFQKTNTDEPLGYNYEFVMAQPNLGLRMERVVREIYTLYGATGVERLRGTLRALPALVVLQDLPEVPSIRVMMTGNNINIENP